MRSLNIAVKLILFCIVATSILSGCVVVERPYHHYDGGERYHGRHC